jgi:hypothetical protein
VHLSDLLHSFFSLKRARHFHIVLHNVCENLVVVLSQPCFLGLLERCSYHKAIAR